MIEGGVNQGGVWPGKCKEEHGGWEQGCLSTEAEVECVGLNSHSFLPGGTGGPQKSVPFQVQCIVQ